MFNSNTLIVCIRADMYAYIICYILIMYIVYTKRRESDSHSRKQKNMKARKRLISDCFGFIPRATVLPSTRVVQFFLRCIELLWIIGSIYLLVSLLLSNIFVSVIDVYMCTRCQRRLVHTDRVKTPIQTINIWLFIGFQRNSNKGRGFNYRCYSLTDFKHLIIKSICFWET